MASSGDDAGLGTAERPHHTIRHAADMVEPGGTVTIHGGIYAGTVRLTKSGSYFGRAVTIQGAPGEKVVLDGKGLAPSYVLLTTAGQDHLVI